MGWVNTKVLDETGDQQKAQGWAPLILDTNGNGKQDAWVEPDDPIDPTKDKRIDTSFYGIAVSPVDGSVWGNANAFPGAAVRVVPGSNPPYTTLAEIYEIPYGQVPGQHVYNPRGIDVDANGVFWTVLASGHYASFDRRKCKAPLNGPNATGKHCAEGWSFYTVPGPNFKGNPESAAADSNYYNWVDKYDSSRRRQERPDCDRQPVGLTARPAERQVGRRARAVPDGLLREADRRPHRRSARRLEGSRLVDDVSQPDAVAYRRREGHAAEGLQVPDAARSAGKVTTGWWLVVSGWW